MRISNNMMTNQMLNSLNRNLSTMAKYQWQTSTGKKIQYASDDPIIASRALKLRTDVNELEVFKKNAQDAQSWLHVTEDALVTIDDILQRARELAVGAASSTQTPEDKQKTAKEIEQLREELITVGNSTYAGKYIFSGYNTDKPLFNKDGTFNLEFDHDKVANDVVRKFNVGVGVQMDTSVTGIDVFGIVESESNGKFLGEAKKGTTVNLDSPIKDDTEEITLRITFNGETKDITFSGTDKDLQAKIDAQFEAPTTLKATVDAGGNVTIGDSAVPPKDVEVEQLNKYENKSELLSVFDNLVSKMEAGDGDAISAGIEDLDNEIEKLLINRAEIGAKDKRVELTLNRLESDRVTFTGLMSQNEDVDMAEVLMLFKNAENVYRASLSVSSKAIQPTLVDFIK